MNKQKQNTRKCPICENELDNYYCATCGWFDAPVIGNKMNIREQERKKLSKVIYEAYKASTQKNQTNDAKTTLDHKKQLDEELSNAKNKIKQLEAQLKQAKEATTQAGNNVSKRLKPVAFLKAEYNNHEQYFALYEGINTFGCETINDNVPDMHNEISLPGDFGLAKKQFEIKITPNKTELTAYAGCNLSRSGSLSNGDTFTTTTNDKTITYKFTF